MNKKRKLRKAAMITPETWRKLMLLKLELNARNIDEVINELLKCWEERKKANSP